LSDWFLSVAATHLSSAVTRACCAASSASALDPHDAYLKAAYADFLLDRDRPREVLPLLRNDTKNDPLLLRLALAEQRLPDERDAFARHRADLAARFDAARRRGDSLHRREEARFRLTIDGVVGDSVSAGVEVTDVTHDSRQAKSGSLFVAVRGELFDVYMRALGVERLPFESDVSRRASP